MLSLALANPVARSLMRVWHRSAKAPGWYYEAVERWGPYMAFSPLETTIANGCRVTCDLADEVQRQIYFFGLYEPVESYLLSKIIGPGMTVVDAGANVGQYTLLASTLVGPSGQVHSFEPVPGTFERLQDNVSQNGLKNVRLNRLALWDRVTSLELGCEQAGNAGSYSVSVPGGLRVVATALDDYINENHIPHVDVIKMDVEGAELFAMRGMRRLIERDHPLLLVEINRATANKSGYPVDNIWKFLVEECGYRGFSVGLSPQSCGELTSLDHIQQHNVIFHAAELPSDVVGGWELRSILRWAASRGRLS